MHMSNMPGIPYKSESGKKVCCRHLVGSWNKAVRTASWPAISARRLNMNWMLARFVIWLDDHCMKIVTHNLYISLVIAHALDRSMIRACTHYIGCSHDSYRLLNSLDDHLAHILDAYTIRIAHRLIALKLDDHCRPRK